MGNLSKSNADSSVKVNYESSYLLNPSDWKPNNKGSSSNLLSPMNGATPNADSSALSRYKKRKEKEKDLENMHIEYDKVRWPGYKDIIYRKRNQDHLPYDTRKIERILELGNDPSIWSKRSARDPNNKGILFDSGFECGNID